MISRRPKVDYFSLTFPTDVSGMVGGYSPGGFFPTEFRDRLISLFEKAGLYGISFEKRVGGYFNYHYSFVIFRTDFLTKKSFNVGLLAYSDLSSPAKHNKGFFFSLSGQGCRGVDFKKVFKVLEIYDPKITRIDIALDYYYGEVSLEQIVQMYHENAFFVRGFSPQMNLIAPKRLDKEGNLNKSNSYTLEIGVRGNPKFTRVYEKGLKDLVQNEENPFPDWVRIEVEFRSGVCEIPYDFLNDLDGALMGAYPNLFSRLPIPLHVTQDSSYSLLSPHDLSNFNVSKLLYKLPEFQVSLYHLIHYMRLSYGGVINILKQMSLDDSEIVELISLQDQKKIPNRLMFPLMDVDSLKRELAFSV